jgi:hypothetical protein
MLPGISFTATVSSAPGISFLNVPSQTVTMLGIPSELKGCEWRIKENTAAHGAYYSSGDSLVFLVKITVIMDQSKMEFVENFKGVRK